MRPASNSTAAATGAVFRHWNSPIPYLFGGIAAMLGLIAIALVILACSWKESSTHGDEAEEKPSKQGVAAMQLEMEPKIVVIMAGDENPTYIANPIRHVEQQA
ncbi:Protein GLUTAMINE DUMPER 4 [Hibiscus syriacus]|uniref:Protein GLUTAMINE DUMPER 4 n=1 Tax=Hibiscus syriacus TaxID=106335 RepID=A0A6A2ZYS6_HIBSY|nr:protein GLUTAMINE DUMPER 4-like [Hibiscus syriacus]KAE8696045.1 Protein GLUTAMINE DUMPER 4 [Hibiscus syriacus]